MYAFFLFLFFLFLKLEGAAYVQVCSIIPEHPVTLCNLRISVTISVTFNTDLTLIVLNVNALHLTQCKAKEKKGCVRKRNISIIYFSSGSGPYKHNESKKASEFPRLKHQ